MPLSYYPVPGEILLCDYGVSAEPPEMVKRRPVIVVTPRLRRRGELVGVIPLSTTEPQYVEPFHCRVELKPKLPVPFDAEMVWAKCDMYSVVARRRLDRFKAGRSGAKRAFVAGRLNDDQLRAVRQAMLHGLGMGSLTGYL